MENIHDTAAELGIQRPQLEYQQHMEGPVTVVELTQDSNQLWSGYLRDITMAKIALNNTPL